MPWILETVFIFKLYVIQAAFTWNRYEIGTDTACVYMGPGRSITNRICYLVPNGSTYEGDPIWNCTTPVSSRSIVSRVDKIPNESEHILHENDTCTDVKSGTLTSGVGEELLQSEGRSSIYVLVET